MMPVHHVDLWRSARWTAAIRLRLLQWCVAGVVALEICFFTGLITGWGNWYSPFRPYRLQTDALLAGDIALSSSPTGMEHDLAWGRGGVQQVWGLGVPLWRLPFEVAARILGQPAFPDRLALAGAIAISTYLLIRVVLASPPSGELREWLQMLADSPARPTAVIVLVLFPPIVMLCSGPFNVYEEAVAYGYYYTITMFAFSLFFAKNPALHWYILLSLMGGAAGFVRPTLLSYGIATMVWSFMTARSAKWTLGVIFLGPVLFATGVLALLATNVHRFGDPMEFGHQLTISAGDLMHVTRFRCPYSDEPLLSAAAELFGSLFLVQKLNGFRVYESRIVAFQSATMRWRHFYQTTFDVTTLTAILVFWTMAGRTLGRSANAAINEVRGVAVWTATSSSLLVLFYVRFACMSSRYLLDFAPAFGVAVAALIIASSNLRVSRRIKTLIAASVAVWWTYEIMHGEHAFPSTPVFAQAEALDVAQPRQSIAPEFPNSYHASDISEDHLQIHGNCRGWYGPKGSTEALVALFVCDPTTLEIDIAPVKQPLEPGNIQEIQARLGNVRLHLASLIPRGNGYRLAFAIPDGAAIRSGVQLACIALTTPTETAAESPYLLKYVRWRKENRNSMDRAAATPESPD
jgi:hypothetical protein